ncbi:hypothetical protein FOZ62_008261, partial [Perkinsus olseni]
AYVKTLNPEEVTYAQVECAVRNNFQLPGIADVPAAAVDGNRSYPSTTVERPKKPWETPEIYLFAYDGSASTRPIGESPAVGLPLLDWVLVVDVGSLASCE